MPRVRNIIKLTYPISFDVDVVASIEDDIRSLYEKSGTVMIFSAKLASRLRFMSENPNYRIYEDRYEALEGTKLMCIRFDKMKKLGNPRVLYADLPEGPLLISVFQEKNRGDYKSEIARAERILAEALEEKGS